VLIKTRTPKQVMTVPNMDNGAVVLLPHSGSEDGQEIVVDEVNAISQPAEWHESLPRQKPIDKT
jgi:hypothetical protein